MNQNGQFAFDFSIIMAVYNVEPFIREAVDSVVAQDIGFENVQLILVDDGSPDGSGAICDEYAQVYPRNVVAIHKENGGAASARNAGLRAATGRYINFMDPDDRLTENTLTAVRDFFAEHEDETDMVAIPMHFFEAQTGEHWQNTKFHKGNRVIDLTEEFRVQQTSSSSTFYSSRVKELLEFDTRLPNNEDFKVNLRVLAERQTLGVVRDCKYWYRRRATGAASTVQGMTANKRWYFDWFYYLSDWACQFYRERFGEIPAYVQYGVLCDLLWRYAADNSRAMAQTLNEDEQQAYVKLLKRTLRNYNDEYIMALPVLNLAQKCLMLQHKYDSAPRLSPVNGNDIRVRLGKTLLANMSIMSTQIEFVQLEAGRFAVEGFTNLLGVSMDERVSVQLLVNGQPVKCRVIDRPKKQQIRFGVPLVRSVGFAGETPLDANVKRYEIQVQCTVRGMKVIKKSLECGRFVPVASGLAHSYYLNGGWKLQADREKLMIERAGFGTALSSEFMFLRELWQKNGRGMRKAVPVRLAYHLLKRFKRGQIWLLSDRVNRAGDNGEALFRYLAEKPVQGVKPVFVIAKDSADYERMGTVGRVVEYISHKHKLLHLLADCLVSSAGDISVQNPFGVVGECYKDIQAQKPYVFLQHGITKDDQSNWLNRYNKNISGFVTSAQAEYRSIVDGAGYGYPAESIWLTGMPRYDRLYRDPKKKITIMPTWRQYLMNGFNSDTGVWDLSRGFMESSYFLFYSQLLKHPRLLAAAKELGYEIQFYPHPNIMQHIDIFEADPAIRILHEDTEYRTVFAESDLLLTDYSSAVFDFVYMHQPIVYAHFDADEFFGGAHVYEKGYFDYERDGFGEVEYDLESTVDRMIEYMRNGCAMKDEYRQRVDRFFAFTDQQNCARVTEKIVNMLK